MSTLRYDRHAEICHERMYVLIPIEINSDRFINRYYGRYCNSIMFSWRRYNQFELEPGCDVDRLLGCHDILVSRTIFFGDCINDDDKQITVSNNKKTRELSKLKIDKEIKLYKRTPKNQKEKKEYYYDKFSSSFSGTSGLYLY